MASRASCGAKADHCRTLYLASSARCNSGVQESLICPTASVAFQLLSLSHQSMECFYDLKSAAGISRRHFSGAADDGTWDLGAGDAILAMPGTNACIRA